MPLSGDGLFFRLPYEGGGLLTFEPDVLETLSQNRQRRRWSAEACGQLFARFEGSDVIISEATGPRPSDRRGRYFCHPDRRIEQREIDEMFLEGLHYIGDWHTHPVGRPTPSGEDERNMVEILKSARHQLRGLLLVIVGLEPFPEGLWVGLHCPGKQPIALGLA